MNVQDECPCPVCAEKARVYDEEKLLADYIASLPAHIRADASVFEQRLSTCLQCPHHRQNLCTLCGCYVHARAAKAKQHCPDPSGRRW